MDKPKDSFISFLKEKLFVKVILLIYFGHSHLSLYILCVYIYLHIFTYIYIK